ncbi:MAG: pentapeptide repeat-containing protein [Desulfurellales bacterium]|nr:MAG: pentapeptide repeat-containing protein [Desulfurellales bacterium]
MRIQITARFAGAVLFEHEAENNTVSLTLVAAVKARAYLAGANLGGANLDGAYLDGAYLAGANLAGANLAGANLAGANLARAYLAGANLGGANLDGAYLDGAYLAGVYLDGANLDGANLDGAYLAGAYLAGEVLNKAPISLLNLQWPVLITGQYMRIGCQRHTHEVWRTFTDAEIAYMAKGALAFWRNWKAPLLALCGIHRGEALAAVPQTEAEVAK